MNSISIEKLLKINNPIIIDIRYIYDYNKGYIPSAINIPYYKLNRNYRHFLNNIDTYYLYCDNGEKSIELCKKLYINNYKTINIDGGYNAYQKYILSKNKKFTY